MNAVDHGITRPSHRIRRTAHAYGLLVLLFAAGCPASSDDVRPPVDEFFFPSGVTLSPDGAHLFVANANSELRYDSGTIITLDIPAIAQVIDDWTGGGTVPADTDDCVDCCEPDVLQPTVLICNEKRFVRSGGSVRIGNFVNELAVQTLDDGNLRVFATVRGDPSVTWVDVDAATGSASCGNDQTFPECDADHRVAQMRDDPDLASLNSEPFGIHVDSTNGYAVVTHLSTGAISVIDAPTDGSSPMLTDSIVGLFLSNPSNGLRGTVGVAGRLPGTPDDLVYVTSRTEARVQTLVINRGAGEFPLIVPSNYFFLDRVLPSDDSRGIVFSDDGNRAYVVNRDPAMLQVIDTSLSASGPPTNELLRAIELCPRPSVLSKGDVGDGERLYVSCFQDSQIWVMDPLAGELQSIISTGSGTHNTAIAGAQQLLFAVSFLDDTVSVVDLTPNAQTENRVVLKLGRTRASGGE